MKHFIISIFACIALVALTSCEEDFYERFVPEIMYYQYETVETADFNQISLANGVTQYTLKARVSAPNKLRTIQMYREDNLIHTVDDFSHSPKETEYFMSEDIKNINGTVKITIVATDHNGKNTAKTFTIN